MITPHNYFQNPDLSISLAAPSITPGTAAMSTFGRVFRVTTFGESHGVGVGAVIDGCPPCMQLSEADIQPQLNRRRPGQSRVTTSRKEADRVSILSGVERGLTLGTPISLLVHNRNVRKQDYAAMATVPRPGHADYTYQAKYGVKASSGGGRSSARETVARVAAGAVAEKWLRERHGVTIVCFVSSVGPVSLPQGAAMGPGDGSVWTRSQVDARGSLTLLRPTPTRDGDAGEDEDENARRGRQEAVFVASFEAGDADVPAYVSYEGAWRTATGAVIKEREGWTKTQETVCVRCPCPQTACHMASTIRSVKAASDSIGGVLTCICSGVPAGWGEPCFEKLEASLAGAMLSLPATKGFEIGSGFAGTCMRGSQHNDRFVVKRRAARHGDATTRAPKRQRTERTSGDDTASVDKDRSSCDSSSCAGAGAGAGAGATAVVSPVDNPDAGVLPVSPDASGPSVNALLSSALGPGFPGASSLPELVPESNNAGGTLGGISSGAPLLFRVAIKPVSTIGQPQATTDFFGADTVLAAKGRHDSCVLPRAPPLVEGMAALVLADAGLQQHARLGAVLRSPT